AKNIVGFNLLTFDRDKHTVSFQKKGIKVDFGGITKGWAVDMVAKKLLKMGLKKGFINLGGNIFSIGKHTILIKNPADPTKNCSGITLQNQGIATSGNYEQFIEIDGKKYTHIIDPRTGMPVPGVDCVSVVSPSAAWSDILSTAIFIEGQDLLKKLKKSPDIHALILDIKGDKNSVIKQGTIWGEIDLQR
ncbi:MAG: FAD:protein FMN transferase, partial [Lentisphaeraceae bacterium]|nr:FAD:protein FMN transferase [Lentisphaeraceae bacterium]